MDGFCCAVDWGTSSFRLWVLDHDGEILADRAGSNGMSTLELDQFEPFLEKHLGELGVGKKIPAVICGMAGSAQGWRQAPYLDVPADVHATTNSAIRVPTSGRDVRILPGLAQRKPGAWDVMRGEETILLGAVVGQGVSGTVCLPGTHSKWAEIEDGRVIGFSTAMTGEIFKLLSEKSTLSHYTKNTGGDFSASPEFAASVLNAIGNPERFLNLLFSVRAEPLLTKAHTTDDMAARLSGLLIGLEIAGMNQPAAGSVTLISSGALAASYSAAFKAAGIAHTSLDAAASTQTGLYQAAKLIWP